MGVEGCVGESDRELQLAFATCMGKKKKGREKIRERCAADGSQCHGTSQRQDGIGQQVSERGWVGPKKESG